MNTIRVLIAILVMPLALLLTLPVLLILLPFWAVAILTGLIARILEPQSLLWHHLIEFDQKIGWKPKANLRTYYISSAEPEVFSVKTDSEGWAGNATIDESELLVIGDSYAFGFGVDADAHFANLSGQLRVKAIGAPGYNMVQELLLMRQLSSRLMGKVVVWFIYYGNDLYDNLSPEMAGYRTPFVREASDEAEWEVVTSHVSPKQWSVSTGRLGRVGSRIIVSLHTPGDLSHRAFSACNFLIHEANRLCTSSGATLIIMGLPYPRMLNSTWVNHLQNDVIDVDLPDMEIERICKRSDIPFIAAKEYLDISDYRTVDDHWNKRGHQRISNVLNDVYGIHVRDRNNKCLQPVVRVRNC